MPWLKRLSRRGRSLIWVSVCGKHEEDIVLPWMMHIERYLCHNRCICCSYAPYAWGKTTICLNFYSYESVVFPCHSDHFAVWLNRYNACSSEYLQGCWSYAINSTKVKRILPLWLPKYKHWPQHRVGQHKMALSECTSLTWTTSCEVCVLKTHTMLWIEGCVHWWV